MKLENKFQQVTTTVVLDERNRPRENLIFKWSRSCEFYLLRSPFLASSKSFRSYVAVLAQSKVLVEPEYHQPEYYIEKDDTYI
jgi:hypothetical protein